MDIAASYDGLHLCTIADDRSLKVFDVINFGMFMCSSFVVFLVCLFSVVFPWYVYEFVCCFLPCALLKSVC